MAWKMVKTAISVAVLLSAARAGSMAGVEGVAMDILNVDLPPICRLMNSQITALGVARTVQFEEPPQDPARSKVERSKRCARQWRQR